MSTDYRHSDAELLDVIRAGNPAPYHVLYERHAPAARVLARRLVKGEAAVEKVVAETFARVLELIRRGGGPSSAFRPYLLTALRRIVDDPSPTERFDPGEPFVDPALPGLERSPMARAFFSMPERWRLVLWHTDVEGAKPADVAPLLGLPANGVASLAYRAREGFRRGCLQAHAAETQRAACRSIIGKMSAYARGGLATPQSRAVAEHLRRCVDCELVFMEISDIDRGLRSVIGPLIAGQAIGGYLADVGRAETLASGGGVAGLWRRVSGRWTGITVTLAAAIAFLLAPALLLAAAEPDVRTVRRPGAPIPAPLPPVVQDPRASAPGRVPKPDSALATTKSADAATGFAASGRAPLVASIDPVGALVRGQLGVVAVRIRNTGRRPTGEITAAIDLPRGVVARPVRHPAPGWSCHGRPVGLRCVRPALHPGAATVMFLQVKVSLNASEGTTPALRVTTPAPNPETPRATDREARPRETGGGGARGSGEAPTRRAGGEVARGSGEAPTRRAGGEVARGSGEAPTRRAGGDAARGSGDAPVRRVRVYARAGSGIMGEGASARFAGEGRLVTRAVGNTLVSCTLARPGCEAARRRARGHRDNDRWSMGPLDQDTESSTASSSAADLKLPADVEIVWAGLYWSANVPETGHGDGAKFGSDDRPGIRLRVPGAERYAQVVATDVRYRGLPSGLGYQAFADVTELAVRAAHATGTWWAADAALRSGVAQHAGWSLVVVASDRGRPHALPRTRVAVLDAAMVIGGGHKTRTLPLNGLSSAGADLSGSWPTPRRAAWLDLVAWDGDGDLTGDSVVLDGRPLRPEGGDRDPGNVFDGSANGAIGSGGTFGTEVHGFHPLIGPDPVLRIAVREDVLLFGVAAITVFIGS